MASDLDLAQQRRARRGEALVDARLEYVLDKIGLSEERCLQLAAEDVGPHARKKLKGILDKYRKSPHPFRACMRDNTSRFGKDRAERICAKLKDIIRGTTKWREGPKGAYMSDGVDLELCDLIDDDVALLLEHVDTKALAELLAEEE